MKTLLPLFVLLLSFPIFAQSRITSPVRGVCTLTVKDSPVVRGFQLGMSEENVKKIVGHDVWLAVPKSVLSKLKGFEDVDYISFDFYNGRLWKLAISYDTSIRWRNVQEFARPLTVSLKIPGDAWVFHGDATGTMACKGFTIDVDALRNQLTLTVTDSRAAFRGKQ